MWLSALSIFLAKLRSVICKDDSKSKRQETAVKIILIVGKITYISMYVKYVSRCVPW